MSELTEKVRKMLSQAQVFARDTPFEAVSRARQAVQVVEEALTRCSPEERSALDGLRTMAAARLVKYEAVLASWLEQSRLRGERYDEQERAVLDQPLRARPKV
jgi:hypothetical protein